MATGEREKSASPVMYMSWTKLGPLLPPYVAKPVQVMSAVRGDCSPRLIARTWALILFPVTA